jgi:hypothetical protein
LRGVVQALRTGQPFGLVSFVGCFQGGTVGHRGVLVAVALGQPGNFLLVAPFAGQVAGLRQSSVALVVQVGLLATALGLLCLPRRSLVGGWVASQAAIGMHAPLVAYGRLHGESFLPYCGSGL